MRIAICGIRGIPACYGGFETFADEIAPRLSQAGHKITVYGRKHVINYSQNLYKGVNIKLFWAPRNKYLETPVHTLVCIFDLIFNRPDVVLVCNGANSPFIWLLRLFCIPVVVNVDGIERMRAKWNKLGKLWYRLGEICSVLFSTKMVADAGVIAAYYKHCYGADSEIIPYGCSREYDNLVEKKTNGQITLDDIPVGQDIFNELGIEVGEYILYVSRLEPENNAHTVIEAYNRLPADNTKPPLVIVGDAPYADKYKASLLEKSGKGVIFAGYRFGDYYRALQLGAKLYIQATEVGGTHPALVEAMGFGNCIVVNETPENMEVIDDAGEKYAKNDASDLCLKLTQLLNSKEQIMKFRRLALRRAQAKFDWQQITNSYISLFTKICSK